MRDSSSAGGQPDSTFSNRKSLTENLAIGTALASVVLLSYGGRNAYAACVGGGGTYVCSGNAAANPNTITLTGSPLSVTTSAGFGISTADPNAFDLDGTGGLIFTDNFASDITGMDIGISAENTGSGAISITTTGAVEGTTSYAISVHNPSGTGVTINAHTVTGDAGIRALNNGSGSLSITTTGVVEGTSGAGILALSNYGTGDVTINTTADVISAADDGIFALNHFGTDVTVNANKVTGARNGILVTHRGTGAVSITATGDATGTAASGIYGYNATGTDLTINAQNSTGGTGIYAKSFGSGTTSVTVSGAVIGTIVDGIRIISNPGQMSIITLNSGADVYGASGNAIFNEGVRDFASDTTVLVNSGAQVRGNVVLGDGSDTLLFDGGTFDTGDILDGGDDTSSADGFVDQLTITGMTRTVLTSQIINWEKLGFIGSDFTITGNIDTPEMLSLTNGTILTVDGDFNGVGGSLALDVDLPTDSASRLMITGNVTGSPTTIAVDAENSGPTTGNPIALINVAGTKTDADFELDGNPIGAYLFDLELIGDNFSLTNAVFSPETSLFEAYGHILAGLNGLSNFDQRFGDRYIANSNNAALGSALLGYANANAGLHEELDQAPANNGLIWARIEGSHSKLAPGQSSTASQYVTNQGKIQAGIDGQITEGEQGSLFAGANASFGKAQSDITSGVGNGTIDATGTAIGASLTWLATNGFYADGQAQFSWFKSDLASDGLGDLESGNDGTGVAVGLEIGQRFENGTGLAITPQAQLIYSTIDFESFTSAYGTDVTADELESLSLRTGLIMEHGFSVSDSKGEDGTRLSGFGNVQLIANLYHEFLDEVSVVVSNTPLKSEPDAWTGELGLGASFTSVQSGNAIYGNALVSGGLDNTFDSYAVKGSAGVKLPF